MHRILSHVEGPLVNDWMRNVLPYQHGNRTYNFLRFATSRARKKGHRINANLLVDLANNWRFYTGRKPKSLTGLLRQAENAIDFIQKNPQY